MVFKELGGWGGGWAWRTGTKPEKASGFITGVYLPII